MAGTVIRVMPKRTLDFTAVSSGSGQAQEIVLAQGIDVSAWREVSLMVRTHANNLSVAIGQIDILAYLEGRTAEDPGILFTSAANVASVTVNASTAAGTYVVQTLGGNVGAMVKVTAKGTRSGSTGANALKADLSIDLSCKSA